MQPITSAVLCVYVIIWSGLPALTNSHDDDVIQTFNENDLGGPSKREKRSLIGTISPVLKTAWIQFQTKDHKYFRKIGKYKDAVRDFRRLKPTNVGKQGERTWGAVGDAYVELHSAGKYPALSIQSRNGDKLEKVVIEYVSPY